MRRKLHHLAAKLWSRVFLRQLTTYLIVHSLMLCRIRLVEFQRAWIASWIQHLGFVSLHLTRLQKNNNITYTQNLKDLSLRFTCVNLAHRYEMLSVSVCLRRATNHRIICWLSSLHCHKIARKVARIEVNL